MEALQEAYTEESLAEKRARLSQRKQALLEKWALGRVGATELDVALQEPLPSIMPAPDERHEPFPLTDVQQAYWIGRSGTIELGNVATHAYQELEAVGLDLERFELAWQRVIERHDMLRAIVRPDGQQQIVEQVPSYRIETYDLRGQDCETVAAHLEAVRQQMSHQVLPADQCPLMDIHASLLDGQRVRLHLSLDFLMLDAWSAEILKRELAQLYRDIETSLVPLELSFRDYVLTEVALRESGLYERSLEYWQGRLPTLSPPPELPLATSPGSITHPYFVRREARLEPGKWRRLKVRIGRMGLTPSGVLLAAFAELLTVWSKNPRFTINLTLFNRLPLHPQVNDIVGDFTSLTLLEVDNSGHDDGFEARVRRIQEQLWKDMEHQYVSGVQLMRKLAQMQQGGSPRALMPVVFTSTLVQTSPGQQAVGPSDGDTSQQANATGWGIPMDVVYTVSQTPQVWLDHQVVEEDGVLLLSWDAVEELFPEGLLDDMFEAYCCLLHRLVDDEEAWQETTEQLIPLPAAQHEQQAVVNATDAPVPTDLLHTLFVAQVSQRPAQAAVVTSDRTLTYENLYRRANQVGHWLREKGAQPNRLVAVVMEKGWEQVAAVLGILQSGAAYLPVTADLPQERIDYLLAHGEVELALTQSWVEEKLSWPENIQRLCVDGDLEGLEHHPLEPIQKQEDLAYVIYTSGSTGQPKGVMIDHRGALNTILDINQRFGVGPEDRVLALSSLSFDLSVYDIFGTLAAGGTIVIPDASGRRDPAHWAELMTREQVTVWNSVPALMEMIVEYANGRSELLPDSLRLVLLSGDWIPVTLPDRIEALVEEVDVISLGGATEASIWSILYPIEEVDPAWSGVPYGRPMINQTFHVLDEALEPRPRWVPGQLYIGGIGLAKGYWRDEEKTQTSFITHSRTGERLYRTGDLGRYLPDGNIEFLGREDFQVKIRGHRIELGEVEATLMQHPAVQANVTTAVGDPRGDKRLVAYVVLNQEMLSTLDEQKPAPDIHTFQDYKPSGVAKGVLLDPVERLRFKLAQPGLRRMDGGDGACIQLAKPELDEALLDEYVVRRSYRKFEERSIPLKDFSQFLSYLLQVELDRSPLPKYRYGSAGSLYPVQTYLYLKPDRVEGVAGGVYYYSPREHQLLPLSTEARIDRSVYGPGNQMIFETSAFALFFIGQLDAITPLYGEWARDFCMLEAGLMTQLIEMSVPTYRIGLCQIGGLDFEPIRHWFALRESHVYLHSLLGGPIDVSQTRFQAFMEDSSDIRALARLVREDPDGAASERFLTSFASTVVQKSKPDGAIIKELRGFVRDKLPEYMVPSAFVLLDTLPLTPNGKVDRRALPEPDAISPKPEKTFIAPQTELERKIADVWREVLQIERIGVHDNFFELGGNSVYLVRVHGKLQELVQDLPITKLFEYPTIHSLTRYVGEESQHSALERSRERAQDRKASRRRRLQAGREN